MKRNIIRQAATIIAVIVTIAVNTLANLLPLNGQATGSISDGFDSRFTPAGFTFSIWGVIYLGLIAFAVYQALPAQRNNPTLRAIGPWFVLSCVANAAWIFAWHWLQYGLSMLLMLVLLASLIVIYGRIAQNRSGQTRADRWLIAVPFSIYLGWITVATIANAVVVLLDLGWTGAPLDPSVWSAIMIGAGTIIAGTVAWLNRDLAYVLVPIWAFIGIIARFSNDTTVAVAAGLGIVVLGALILLRLWPGARAGRLQSQPG